jgi:hypothetical protein
MAEQTKPPASDSGTDQTFVVESGDAGPPIEVVVGNVNATSKPVEPSPTAEKDDQAGWKKVAARACESCRKSKVTIYLLLLQTPRQP